MIYILQYIKSHIIYDVLIGEFEQTINMDNLYNVKNRRNLISITDIINDIFFNQETSLKNYVSNENVAQKNKINKKLYNKRFYRIFISYEDIIFSVNFCFTLYIFYKKNILFIFYIIIHILILI